MININLKGKISMFKKLRNVNSVRTSVTRQTARHYSGKRAFFMTESARWSILSKKNILACVIGVFLTTYCLACEVELEPGEKFTKFTVTSSDVLEQVAITVTDSRNRQKTKFAGDGRYKGKVEVIELSEDQDVYALLGSGCHVMHSFGVVTSDNKEYHKGNGHDHFFTLNLAQPITRIQLGTREWYGRMAVNSVTVWGENGAMQQRSFS